MWPSLSLMDARNRLDLFDLCHVQRVRLDLRLGGLHDVARRIGERRLSPRADQDLHALPRIEIRRARIAVANLGRLVAGRRVLTRLAEEDLVGAPGGEPVG
jgi:hypothetical protein